MLSNSDLLILVSIFVWLGSLGLLFAGLILVWIRSARRIGLFLLAGSVGVWIISMGTCAAGMPTMAPLTEKRDTRTPERRPSAEEPVERESDGAPVTYQLESSNTIDDWLTTETPTLVVRCRHRQTEVYVVAETSASNEFGKDNLHTVRLRIDDQPWEDATWSESVDDDTLFAPDGLALAGRLSAARRLTFEFTPFGADAQAATFHLAGVASGVQRVARACGWTPPTDAERR
jgi:hypothetical protein